MQGDGSPEKVDYNKSSAQAPARTDRGTDDDDGTDRGGTEDDDGDDGSRRDGRTTTTGRTDHIYIERERQRVPKFQNVYSVKTSARRCSPKPSVGTAPDEGIQSQRRGENIIPSPVQRV